MVHFDARSQTYQQYQAGLFNNLNSLSGKQAYWLKLDQSSNWAFFNEVNTQAQPLVQRLVKGWNQLQLPSQEKDNNQISVNNLSSEAANKAALQALTQNSTIEAIWYYQQSQDQWYHWIKGQDQ